MEGTRAREGQRIGRRSAEAASGTRGTGRGGSPAAPLTAVLCCAHRSDGSHCLQRHRLEKMEARDRRELERVRKQQEERREAWENGHRAAQRNRRAAEDSGLPRGGSAHSADPDPQPARRRSRAGSASSDAEDMDARRRAFFEGKAAGACSRWSDVSVGRCVHLFCCRCCCLDLHSAAKIKEKVERDLGRGPMDPSSVPAQEGLDKDAVKAQGRLRRQREAEEHEAELEKARRQAFADRKALREKMKAASAQAREAVRYDEETDLAAQRVREEERARKLAAEEEQLAALAEARKQAYRERKELEVRLFVCRLCVAVV